LKQKTKVAIGLGSNLGDRKKKIEEAVGILSEEFLEDAKVSRIYESEPWGIKDQPKFLNAVIVGLSEWKPPAILNYIKNLERELGRTATVKNGPRVLDLDLLAFGSECWDQEGLVVPHPGIPERDFVLLPFQDVWPEWVHPTLKLSITQLCEEFSRSNASLTSPTR
jgi:2-amino-4-hydroxy-6-hydroxymethyldihydropteridine diphosphokinase